MLVGLMCLLASTRVLAAPPVCGDEVKTRFARREFLEAAHKAEECWVATHDGRMLFFAGQAWEKAGRHAHAVRNYRRLLVDPPVELRARTEEFLRGALARTGAVEFVAGAVDLREAIALATPLDPRGEPLEQQFDALGATPVLQLDPGRWEIVVRTRDGRSQRHEVKVEVVRPARLVLRQPPEPVHASMSRLQLHVGPARALRRGVQLELRPLDRTGAMQSVVATRRETPVTVAQGPWRVEASAPGYEVATTSVVVNDKVANVHLALRPGRELRVRRGLAAGLGGVAVGLGVSGAVVLGLGARSADVPLAGDTEGLREFLGASALRSRGAAVLGASAGALTVALTSAFVPRRRALIIEMAVGGGLTVAGLAWKLVAMRAYERDSLKEVAGDASWWPDNAFLVTRANRELASAVLLGSGASLLGASVVSLVVSRVAPRRRGLGVTPMGVRSAWGLVMRGDF
jgi:hypothetical protein